MTAIDWTDPAQVLDEARRRTSNRAAGRPLSEPQQLVIPASKRPWPILPIELPRPRSSALEKAEQAEIVKVFARFGCRCESTSQTRKSRVALGIPDLWLWLMPIGRAGWWESKSGESWKFSEPQLLWVHRCVATKTPYGCGDRYAAEVFCRALGLREL